MLSHGGRWHWQFSADLWERGGRPSRQVASTLSALESEAGGRPWALGHAFTPAASAGGTVYICNLLCWLTLQDTQVMFAVLLTCLLINVPILIAFCRQDVRPDLWCHSGCLPGTRLSQQSGLWWVAQTISYLYAGYFLKKKSNSRRGLVLKLGCKNYTSISAATYMTVHWRYD